MIVKRWWNVDNEIRLDVGEQLVNCYAVTNNVNRLKSKPYTI